MEKDYAQALWQMVEKGKDPKKAVHALHELLIAHGRSALMPRIAHAFSRIAQEDAFKNTMTLSVASEKDSSTAKKEVKAILGEMNIDADDLSVAVDQTLIGGWRLEGREQLVDGSFKKSLLEMYNRATA